MFWEKSTRNSISIPRPRTKRLGKRWDWVNTSDMFFFVAHADDVVHTKESGYEVWKTDGTENGTSLAKKIVPYCCNWADPIIQYADTEPRGFWRLMTILFFLVRIQLNVWISGLMKMIGSLNMVTGTEEFLK